jgi:hypothetical protein
MGDYCRRLAAEFGIGKGFVICGRKQRPPSINDK